MSAVLDKRTDVEDGHDSPDELFADPIDTDDGGAIIQIAKDEAVPTADEGDFYENLVDVVDSNILKQFGTELHELIMRDRDARSKRDEQYEEGLRRTGMGNDAPGGAAFQGATRVVHPMLTKASIDFSSRTVKELLPAGGPVRTDIKGKTTPARLEKADRITRHMNWQLTRQIEEFQPDVEQGLTQEAIGGAFYLRMVYEAGKRRPASQMITVDDVWLPYGATSYHTAERITRRELITEQEFQARVRSGLYSDDVEDLPPPSQAPDPTKAGSANQKIEGVSPDYYNQDGLREVFEVMVEFDLEDDDKYADRPAQYLVQLDETSHRILGMVRNWEQDDETRSRMFWMEEFPFIPWRGAYPIGLIHLIGSLAAAATGAMRALLDSGHVNNMPTLLKLKGTNFFGQSLELNATQITEVEGSIATDDIRKLMMAVPFNPPSTVLFELLGFVEKAGQDLIQTTFQDLEDNRNLPVGTTLALIEQGMKVLSAIHSRHHRAMERVLRILYRINKMYLEDEELLDDAGELLAYRSDYTGPIDVAPVSDPEIFSEIQRTAQMQLVEQRAQLMPQLYDLRKVELMILKRTKIPDAEDLLLPAPQASEMNAVNENVALAMGRPVAVYPDQDHLAHIQVLVDFMMSPHFGMLQMLAATILPAALAHLKDHMIMWYLNFVVDLMEKESGMESKDLMQYKDDKTRKEMDRLLAVISPIAMQQAQRTFTSMPAVIQRATAVMQHFQSMNPGPMDPAQANLQIAQQDNNTKQQIAAQQAQLKMQQLQQEAAQASQQFQAQVAKTQQDGRLKGAQLSMDQQNALADRLAELHAKQMVVEAQLRTATNSEAHEDARTAATNEVKQAINTADNVTAIDITQAEIEAGKHATVKDGTAVGRTKGTA